jgi:hypothetical protein
MDKEKKNVKVQIRITSTEKALLAKLMATNKDLTISKLFRDSLHENCQKFGIKIDNSIVNQGNVGSFIVN